MKLSAILRKWSFAPLVATVALNIALTGMTGTAHAAVPHLASTSVAAAGQPAPRLTRLVSEAMHQSTLAISYLYGGGHGLTPAPRNSRVDCSGFVRELYWYAFGVDIGAGSGDSAIRLSGRFTRTSSPVPGDVALFGNNGSAPAFHTGIFVGALNGHPAMVGSPAAGQNIKVQPGLDQYWASLIMGYWHFNGATAADSGLVARPAMVGSFDSAAGRVGGVAVAGWTVDPQNRAAGSTVQVIVDGRVTATLRTERLRADVNRVEDATWAHGFSATISAPVGRHTVCVTARPAVVSTSAKALGCRIVTTAGSTRGVFDRATGAMSTFVVAGWAYDPQSPTGNVLVRMTLDGRLTALVRANLVRTDVNRVVHVPGAHGFGARIAATAGRHTVCAVALPVSTTSAQSSLGCKAITVSR